MLNKSEYNYQNKNIYSLLIEVITIILMISIPVLFYPYLVRNFNPPKTLFFEILTITALAIWLIRMITKEENRLVKTPDNLPVLLFMILGIISLTWSDSPFVTLQELPLFLAGPLLFFIIVNNIIDYKQVYRIVATVIIVGSLMGIYGFLQYQGIDFAFWSKNVGRQQVFGLFGNVNYFAEYIIVPLTIAVPLFFAVKHRIIKILLFIGIIFMGSSLVLTFTRSSYLAFGMALLLMFLLFILREGITQIFSNYRKIIIFFLVLVIIASAMIFIPNPLNERGTVLYKIKARTSIHQLTQGSSIARRIAIWKFTWMMIEDNPILGSGLGTFQYNSLRYQAEFFQQGDTRDRYPYGIADKAHNEYLQLWAELGIIGLVIFIWVIIRFFIHGIRYLKKENNNQQSAIVLGLMGAIMAVLIDALFGFPLHLPASASLFWIAMALVIVLMQKEGIVSIFKIQPDEKKKNCRLQLKYFLYPLIIIGTILLVVMISRPFVAEMHEFWALQNIRRDNFDKAIEHYDLALDLNPYLGMAYFNLAQILSDRGLYTVAMEYYEKAEQYMDHPNLPGNLAYIYLKKGLTDKAILKLEQAVTYQEKEEAMVPLYSNLGKLYLQKRNYLKAEASFKNAIQIDDSNISNHLALAISQLNRGKKKEALPRLKKVIELDPNSNYAAQANDLLQQLARENLEVKN